MDLRKTIDLIEAATIPSKLETAPLPYELDDLSPVLTKENLVVHYEHLAKNYAKKYNAGEGDPKFNKAGWYLHGKLFPQLQPPKGANRPKGAVADLIEANFKTYEDFKEEFKRIALSLHGSGWIYLATDGTIKTIKNHQVRTDICVLVDLWEHAYLDDYKWDKEKYLDNIWKIINWDVCSERI